jgi:hypothetical protein
MNWTLFGKQRRFRFEREGGYARAQAGATMGRPADVALVDQKGDLP